VVCIRHSFPTRRSSDLPCPSDDHPGTPRMFLDRFATPDGRARFVPVEHRAAAEDLDADYPVYLTTGRSLQHYQSGAQTRRIEPLDRKSTRLNSSHQIIS